MLLTTRNRRPGECVDCGTAIAEWEQEQHYQDADRLYDEARLAELTQEDSRGA